MNWSDSGTIWGVIGGLLAFGVLYNAFVGWLIHNGYEEGYVALLVVAGTLVTLGGVALVDVRSAVLALVCFGASGTPMVIGSIWRYMQRRQQAVMEIRREVGQ